MRDVDYANAYVSEWLKVMNSDDVDPSSSTNSTIFSPNSANSIVMDLQMIG